VKLVIDDNNVTIAGHPEEYLKGYNVEKTLEGHGMKCLVCPGEDLDALYAAMRAVCVENGPMAVVAKRKMCPGIEGIEGECHGHDAIAVDKAVKYLTKRGYTDAVAWLQGPAKNKTSDPRAGKYKGTDFKKVGANRAEFGVAVCNILGAMDEKERKEKVGVLRLGPVVLRCRA
jgi:transketolase